MVSCRSKKKKKKILVCYLRYLKIIYNSAGLPVYIIQRHFPLTFTNFLTFSYLKSFLLIFSNLYTLFIFGYGSSKNLYIYISFIHLLFKRLLPNLKLLIFVPCLSFHLYNMLEIFLEQVSYSIHRVLCWKT